MSKQKKTLVLSAHLEISAKENEIRQWAQELSEQGLKFDADDLLKKISVGGGLYDMAMNIAENKGISPKDKKGFQACLDETIVKLSSWLEGFQTKRARILADNARDAYLCY